MNKGGEVMKTLVIILVLIAFIASFGMAETKKVEFNIQPTKKQIVIRVAIFTVALMIINVVFFSVAAKTKQNVFKVGM